MTNPGAAYDELYLYALEQAQAERGDRPQFILQHVVDAQAAQTAPPMAIIRGLRGRWQSSSR